MTQTDASSPIRVFLGDDQQMVRAGFRMLVDSQDDMVVVGDAGDGGKRALGPAHAGGAAQALELEFDLS